MVRREIDTLWDRKTRNDINDNFEELFKLKDNLNDSTEYLNEIIEQGEFLSPRSVTPSKLSFTVSGNRNLFDGDYTNGLLFLNSAENKLVPVFNYGNYNGKIAIVRVRKNTSYHIKKHDNSPLFRVGLSRKNPRFSFKDSDLNLTQPVPESYFVMDITANSDNSKNELTVETGNNEYISVYVSNDGYEPRLQIEKGKESTDYVNGSKIIPREYLEISDIGRTYPDSDAKNAFIQEMNNYAEKLGMKNSHFVEPAGYPGDSEQKMSTRDMITLGVQASGYKELARIWGNSEYTFTVKGSNERELKLKHSADFTEFKEAGYHVFGAKTGGISSGTLKGFHLLFIVNSAQGRLMLGALRQSTKTDRFSDLITAFKNAENNDSNEIVAESASVCFLPDENPFLYHNYDVPLLYGKESDTPGHPASITKVMSAIVALDHLQNMKQKITIKTSDITPGTGNVFEEGDILTVEEALYSMMLPSSNTATHAIARTVGNVILNNK